MGWDKPVDEYYVESVGRLLPTPTALSEIAELLTVAREGRWDLPSDRQADMGIATSLVEWYRTNVPRGGGAEFDPTSDLLTESELYALEQRIWDADDDLAEAGIQLESTNLGVRCEWIDVATYPFDPSHERMLRERFGPAVRRVSPGEGPAEKV